MPLKKVQRRTTGLMRQAVEKSVRTHAIDGKDAWGVNLMLMYADQLDSAKKVRDEVLAIVDEGDTVSKTWHQRLERIEKYVMAEAAITSIGPKLLALMEKFQMTPATIRAGSNTTDVNSGENVISFEERQLQRLQTRANERAAGKASGTH